MTSIQGYKRPCRKHISKSVLGSLSLLESSHDKVPVDPPAVGSFKPPVAKYTEENLQKILRSVIEAQVPSFDGPYEKLLKARSPDINCGNSYIECYNFC